MPPSSVNAHAVWPAREIRTRAADALAVLIVLIALLASSASPAFAAAKLSVQHGFVLKQLAVEPAGATNCDDLAYLDGNLYQGCQNKTMSAGGGGNSTLVEYLLSGAVVKTWSLRAKIDGLAADPAHHRLIVTLDEDANSRLAVVTPGAPAGQQVVSYAYSPDPHSSAATGLLHTGGGTDSVNVDAAGHILIVGSHSLFPSGTGVFLATLTPPSSAGGAGTAKLSPTFSATLTAANGNGKSGSTSYTLGDLDSSTIVPSSSPRFAGSYVITDQTALIMLFMNDIFTGKGPTALKLATGLDDVQWTTGSGGTLYVSNLSPLPGQPSVYKATGPYTTGTVYASDDGISDEVVTVNLTTGKETPFIRGLHVAKGLIYVPADGSKPSLPLNGASAVPVSNTTTSSASSSSASPSSSSSSSSGGGSSNTALIVIIVVVVVVLAGGALYFARRGRSAS